MTFININTPNSLEYRYFPITKSTARLCITASNDARIALRTHLGDDSDVYEIVIGACNNTVSAIKKNKMEPNIVETETKDILNSEKECDLWLQWSYDGTLSVGHDINEIFMFFKDKEPFLINYIGLGTAHGATGEWLIEAYRLTSLAVRQELINTCNLWMDYNDAIGLPLNAVMVNEQGSFIGRGHHKESLTPGSVCGATCTISWGGSGHELEKFEVLCGVNIGWVKSWQGSVPLNALPGGVTEDGYALFIGRVFREGIHHVGKIQPNHQLCYVPINGQETGFQEYETLVLNDDQIIEFIGR